MSFRNFKVKRRKSKSSFPCCCQAMSCIPSHSDRFIMAIHDPCLGHVSFSTWKTFLADADKLSSRFIAPYHCVGFLLKNGQNTHAPHMPQELFNLCHSELYNIAGQQQRFPILQIPRRVTISVMKIIMVMMTEK